MTKPVVLSVSTLMGYKVRNAGAEDLGKVEELVIDQESGRVLYAVLSFGGLLHHQLVAIPWERLRMQPDGKAFFLNIDKETLRNAPHFDRDNWPDMTLPEWRERIEMYFKYSPADP